jgi:hypothetical protein
MTLYTQTKVNLEIKYKHVCFVVCRGITWHNLRRKGGTSSKNQTMQLENYIHIMLTNHYYAPTVL